MAREKLKMQSTLKHRDQRVPGLQKCTMPTTVNIKGKFMYQLPCFMKLRLKCLTDVIQTLYITHLTQCAQGDSQEHKLIS